MRNLLPTVLCLGTRLRIEMHNSSLQRGSCHLFCGGIIDIIQINAGSRKQPEAIEWHSAAQINSCMLFCGDRRTWYVQYMGPSSRPQKT